MKRIYLSMLILFLILASCTTNTNFEMPVNTVSAVGILGGELSEPVDEAIDTSSVFLSYGLSYENRFIVTDYFYHSAHLDILKSDGAMSGNSYDSITGNLFYKFGFIWDTPHENYVSGNIEYLDTASYAYGTIYITGGLQAEYYLSSVYSNDFNFAPGIGLGIEMIGENFTWNALEAYLQFRTQNQPQPELADHLYTELGLKTSLGFNF